MLNLTKWLFFNLSILFLFLPQSWGNKITTGEMVLIPAGEFIMGTNADEKWEGPEHRVYLDAYEIDIYEVTAKDYFDCVTAGKCSKIKSKHPALTNEEHAAPYKKRPTEPIRDITWFDAKSYCEWVSKRLPTEAEWEKAARGPENYANPWGNREFKKGDAGIEGFGAGGSFPTDKSPYGVYDMAGNASEWAADWYSDDYYKESPFKNPTGPLKGKERTVRGGNYRSDSTSYFSVLRFSAPPNFHFDEIGFRCARSVTK